MNQSSLDKFAILRKYILLFSKLVGIMFCLYYIRNSSNYQIRWPLIEYLLPQSISLFLSTIGTFILVIPLTFMITSILLPQNHMLHVISCLFGIMGVLLTLIKNKIFNQPIGEITNFKFLTVQQVLTLPEKRIIFQEEFIRIVNENYISIIKKYDYLMSKLTTEHFIKYDEILNNLKISSQIKQYAADTIINFSKELSDNTSLVTNVPYVMPTWLKITLYAAGTILTVWLINKMLFDNTLKLQTDHATITNEVAKAGTSSAQVMLDGASQTKQLNDSIIELTKEVQKINLRLDVVEEAHINHEVTTTNGFKIVYQILFKISDKLSITIPTE